MALKKKKSAQGKPQPTWLFPSGEKIAVKSPKVQTPGDTEAEKQERLRAVEILKRRAVSTLNKPGPPPQLLNLVAIFLAEYGFHGTCRTFSVERQGRSKLDGWEDELGKKQDKSLPRLTKIYNDWMKGWKAEKQLDESDNSGDGERDSNPVNKTATRGNNTEEETSSSDSGSTGSDSSDDSKTEKKDALKRQKPLPKNAKKDSSSSTASSSTTSEDSDADDETDTKVKPTNSSTNARKSSIESSSDSSSSDSNSDSSSSSQGSSRGGKRRVRKEKLTLKSSKTKPPAAASLEIEKPRSSSASSVSSSNVTSDDRTANNPVSNAKVSGLGKNSSDSSATLVGEDNEGTRTSTLTSTTPGTSASSSSSGSSSSSSSDSSSSSSESTSKKPPIGSQKRKRVVSPASGITMTDTTSKKAKSSSSDTNIQKTSITKTQNKPFSRIPEDLQVDERVASNAYVPYNYADRAHQDLIITKGKGFTKEKNKKKRGSYRGGMIDVDGRKGIKFE
ncbi:MAG: hypothetical protein M1837_002084 [Sclerophora amabilis]|nr:MAG: hypothetical protein M1837_002084 [Sclerophora amabilis]